MPQEALVYKWYSADDGEDEYNVYDAIEAAGLHDNEEVSGVILY